MRKALLILLPFLLGCPQPKPTPTPTPPPVESCCVKPMPGAGWKTVVKVLPAFSALFINEAEMKLGTSCGKEPATSVADLSTALGQAGVCSGPWDTVTIMVARPDGLWEQWQVIRPGDGCWTVPLDDSYLATWQGPLTTGCK